MTRGYVSTRQCFLFFIARLTLPDNIYSLPIFSMSEIKMCILGVWEALMDVCFGLSIEEQFVVCVDVVSLPLAFDCFRVVMCSGCTLLVFFEMIITYEYVY